MSSSASTTHSEDFPHSKIFGPSSLVHHEKIVVIAAIAIFLGGGASLSKPPVSFQLQRRHCESRCSVLPGDFFLRYVAYMSLSKSRSSVLQAVILYASKRAMAQCPPAKKAKLQVTVEPQSASATASKSATLDDSSDAAASHTDQKRKMNAFDLMTHAAQQRHAVGASGTWEMEDNDQILVFSAPADIPGSRKIAAFDMDGTLITTKSGKVFPANADDWKLLFPTQIPEKLQSLSKDGYKIVIFTSQGGVEKGYAKSSTLKTKLGAIAAALNVPLQAFMTIKEGRYRKPLPGAWNLLEEKFNDGIKIDLEESLFVGDAAGRQKDHGSSGRKDHAFSDRLFAHNVGVKHFYTPEEFFLARKPAPYEMPSFRPADVVVGEYSLESVAKRIDAANGNAAKTTPEMVLLVGYPGSGKSTLARKLFVDKYEYSRINRDELKSQEKCLKVAEQELKAGKSVVIDNTNPDRATRQKYLELAKKFKVPCKCVWLSSTLEHAWHNCRFRNLVDAKSAKMPLMVLYTYRKNFETPTVAEGFEEVVKLDFMFYASGDEANDKLYKMYLIEKTV